VWEVIATEADNREKSVSYSLDNKQYQIIQIRLFDTENNSDGKRQFGIENIYVENNQYGVKFVDCSST